MSPVEAGGAEVGAPPNANAGVGTTVDGAAVVLVAPNEKPCDETDPVGACAEPKRPLG